MKAATRAALLAALLAAGGVRAEGETAAPTEPIPALRVVPTGYAFDNPAVLVRQLAWGVAHGVRLLGLACQARGDSKAALAYVDWLDRERLSLRAIERDLARHYFGRDEAPAEAISAALNLKPYLETPAADLAAACATLAEALAAPRYDLERFRAEKCAEFHCPKETP